MNVIEKLATYEDQISPGVSACVGCNVELTLRTCMKVLGPNTIFAVPPGCMGGVGVMGWDKESGAKTPVFFPLLDNVASMLAGIKMHYERIGRKVNVVAFAGDGASVDAGMQCLSGAAERGDKIIYICYDNEGYMNTGYQRSGSTTKGAWTSTTPVINGHGGKKQNKKDFPMIMAMHDVIDNIEKELMEKLHCHAVIHMDPVDTDDASIARLREQVAELVKQVEPSLTIHDFRVVRGTTHDNLIFDAVLPFSSSKTPAQAAQEIRALVRAMDGNYYAVVNVERSYT